MYYNNVVFVHQPEFSTLDSVTCLMDSDLKSDFLSYDQKIDTTSTGTAMKPETSQSIQGIDVEGTLLRTSSI